MKQRWKQVCKEGFVPFVSFILALLIGAVLILMSGNNPLYIYGKMISGIFGKSSGIFQMLLQATPLMFCGLAVVLGMRGGLLNLGVEGQLYIGALLGSICGIYLKGLPAIIHIPVCMLVGMLGGALWAFIPVLLKIKRGAHEVVTALMLNYIAELIVDFATNYPLKDQSSSSPQTPFLESSAILPQLIPRSQVTIAILIGVALILFMEWIVRKTVLGYEITVTGTNKEAAAASGISVKRIMITTMILSGMCSGLAGVMEVMGTYGRLINGFSPGYGFDGIAVAVMGKSPITVIFSALLFGALRAGGMALNIGTNLSVKFITTLQGIIIFLIAAPALSMRIVNFFVKLLNHHKGVERVR